MNKKALVIIILILLALAGSGLYFYFSQKNSNEPNYEASKTATNVENNTNIENQTNTNTSSSEETQKQETNKEESNNEEAANESKQEEQTKGITEEDKKVEYKEEEIATFSTKIYSSDSARQNNIKITCNTLNGTTVKNGSTFSFCQTVGQATSSKGYQEADIFDHNGTKKKGLGGGNCQVSSTLYNAVLAVPSLVVTERHEHSNSVPYVKKGKDAAVAYGSYDLKFRNDTGNDIKIKASTDDKNVTITLVSLKQV